MVSVSGARTHYVTANGVRNGLAMSARPMQQSVTPVRSAGTLARRQRPAVAGRSAAPLPPRGRAARRRSMNEASF